MIILTPKDFSQYLINRRSYLERVIQRSDQYIAHSPEGSLRISRSSGRTQFYQSGIGSASGRYLAKADMPLTRELAQKDYEKRLKNQAAKELDIINSFLSKYKIPEQSVENVYEQLCKDRQLLVEPLSETDEMFVERWLSYEYVPKAVSEEVPDLVSDRGDHVRSKSELIIANLLASCHVPYRYECPLRLPKWGTVYPDFTVLNVRQRKQFYWEHMGRMDDPDYADKAVKKLAHYNQAGLVSGVNLILTFETSRTPISTFIIKDTIERFLL